MDSPQRVIPDPLPSPARQPLVETAVLYSSAARRRETQRTHPVRSTGYPGSERWCLLRSATEVLLDVGVASSVGGALGVCALAFGHHHAAITRIQTVSGTGSEQGPGGESQRRGQRAARSVAQVCRVGGGPDDGAGRAMADPASLLPTAQNVLRWPWAQHTAFQVLCVGGDRVGRHGVVDVALLLVVHRRRGSQVRSPQCTNGCNAADGA